MFLPPTSASFVTTSTISSCSSASTLLHEVLMLARTSYRRPCYFVSSHVLSSVSGENRTGGETQSPIISICCLVVNAAPARNLRCSCASRVFLGPDPQILCAIKETEARTLEKSCRWQGDSWCCSVGLVLAASFWSSPSTAITGVWISSKMLRSEFPLPMRIAGACRHQIWTLPKMDPFLCRFAGAATGLS